MKVGLAMVVAAACAAPQVPATRFANQPPVWVVDDRRDVPRPPSARAYLPYLHDLDAIVVRPIARALRVERARRAIGVNALDEVPDSTWFTNRIGVRDLTLGELRAGPAIHGSPERHTPWTVLRSKRGGHARGFVVRDARGFELLFKLDECGYPELESGAAAITGKLLWAIGYNVPEEHVVYVHPSDLVVTRDSRHVDALGRVRPLRRDDVERVLAACDHRAGSLVRGLASFIVEGTPLGGHPAEGRRRDDPNDRIPHELRRDLRGAYPIFAWLDHGDAKDGNTLDVWIEDPRDPDHHHVMHYLIDFGKSLGAIAMTSPNKRAGHAYSVDVREMLRSFATAGLASRPWDDRDAPSLRGVGLFEVATYDPGKWRPVTPGYLPFVVADVRDKVWGAKLLVRFTPAQLRAIVETARFSSPQATEYVTRTLIARQRKTARYWLERSSPLAHFAMERERLCFDDLVIRHALAPIARGARYTVERFDREGDPLETKHVLSPARGGRQCVPLALARDRDGYTIVAIDTAGRLGRHRIYVHVARAPDTGVPRVIGIWRP